MFLHKAVLFPYFIHFIKVHPSPRSRYAEMENRIVNVPIPDEDINNKMFVVVRNTKSAQNNLDYKLNRGDIIKLGRIKFNVKDYQCKKPCCSHNHI